MQQFISTQHTIHLDDNIFTSVLQFHFGTYTYQTNSHNYFHDIGAYKINMVTFCFEIVIAKAIIILWTTWKDCIYVYETFHHHYYYIPNVGHETYTQTKLEPNWCSVTDFVERKEVLEYKINSLNELSKTWPRRGDLTWQCWHYDAGHWPVVHRANDPRWFFPLCKPTSKRRRFQTSYGRRF